MIDFYKHGWDDPERFSRRVKERWFLFRELLHYMRGEQVEEVVRVPVARDPSQESPFLDPAFQSVKKQVDLPINTVIFRILSNPTIKAIFPEYQWLAEIYRAIAIASADPERGGSRMKDIKTDLRSTLGQDKLNQLMYISLNGPERRDFELFDKAVIYFFTKSTRRFHMPGARTAENLSHAALLKDRCDWVRRGTLLEASVQNEIKRHAAASSASVSDRMLTGNASTVRRRNRHAAAELDLGRRAEELRKIAIEEGYMPPSRERERRVPAMCGKKHEGMSPSEEVVLGIRARRGIPAERLDL